MTTEIFLALFLMLKLSLPSPQQIIHNISGLNFTLRISKATFAFEIISKAVFAFEIISKADFAFEILKVSP